MKPTTITSRRDVISSCFRLLGFFLLALASAFAEVVESDVCIYGGTSGGVAAAVQAARLGKSVTLVEPGGHLGGMTSGGLSAVDIGDPRSVGGIAREYFTKLAATVGVELAWDQPFEHKSGGPATGGAYAIEPHKAEQLFDRMCEDAGVHVRRKARLSAVENDGRRIAGIVLENGDIVRAKMFIDTTYEGDLMARAGVSFTLMREGNAKYGETYNGIHYTDKYQPRAGHLMPGENGRLPGGQGVWDRDFPLDPYVVVGCPESGLLPLINDGEPGVQGEAAPGVQAYCYRLCLTTDKTNQIAIEPPPDYDPKRYELVARFIEACLANGDDMDLRWFSKHDPLPNDKWDFNTATFGGNLPGLSWEWPEASYAKRDDLAKELESYHRGLLHFLATDSRVPKKVRDDMKRFGLPKDEFTDNGGWPHQVYIREGRRMVSDLVMTEYHTFGREVAPKPVSLGSYGTDTHEIRRIVKDGVVTREGKTATGRGGAPPYPIGYDAIVPKQSECENLFVTFALSASHTAFSSIRMEPVFMCTSQSAGAAACLAMDAGVPAQQVDYGKLREQLVSFGQILEWPKTAATKESSKPNGIVMDDKEGVYQGAWETSARINPFIGTTYQHDNNREQGQRFVTFTPDLPDAGDYEVRLIYLPTTNRATNATVTIHHANGVDTVKVNQRQDLMEKGVPCALGVFHFTQGKAGSVVVSTEGANGYVVVDGVQWLPVELAKKERAGSLDAGFASNQAFDPVAEKRRAMAAAVAFSPLAETKSGFDEPKPDREPIALKTDTQAADVEGMHYDLVVVGGTAGGVATAVTAAREGLSVLLVQHNRHIGGMLANGLMQWDALNGGPRSPLFSELLHNIEQHYIETFGRDSTEHQVMRYTHEHYPISWVEPRIMERECHRLLAGEKNITLLLEHYPVAVKREGALLRSVTLRKFAGGAETVVNGDTFADATYEGDLLALADVPFRVGREARDEYGEPHAGKVFVNIDHGPPQSVVDEGLNIRAYSSHQGSVDPGSPFTADHHPQAYNLRPCVSRDPNNRLMLTEPPPGYDRAEYIDYERKGIATNIGPNRKSHMNSPILPGENVGYPEGTWDERETIFNRHKNFALGLIWFLQNDPSVPESKRRGFREWGLPKDEFTDNGHLPYEMYVREARRLVGRHVMTELDGMMSADYARTPVQTDSIATTDWYMDSHSCTMDSREGFKYDGKLILTEESRPAQIPYRCLLPKNVNNLLVPVCLSSTHIAWGAIRLEPVWMQTGEAAGLAAALAKKQSTTPGALNSDMLIQALAERRHLISFFNEIKVDSDDPRIPAAQYFATKGFFTSYDARLNEPLSESVKRLWTQAFRELKDGSFDARQLARNIHEAEQANPSKVGEQRGAFLLKLWNKLRS